MYLLGYDIGSSSVKAALVEANTNKTVAIAQHPASEMDIISEQLGWAEQHPETWWENVCIATQKLIEKSGVNPSKISAIGISYQMHGLVLIDKNQQVLRPSIIWCDSRAVAIGNQALAEIGHEKCLSHLLNSPGNFTISKLKWVMDNEPEVYEKIDKFLLPGDYIAMKLTGEVNTTISGLSEAILWDFKNNDIAYFLLNHFKIDKAFVPEIVPTFSNQGKLQATTAEKLGLPTGIPLNYRAGDQPNNAMALGVSEPGQIAATGGTSGVVYGISEKPAYDNEQRINGFAHVNHSKTTPRTGVLLCINGAGIQYSWMKKQVAQDKASYYDMEEQASTVPIGSDNVRIIPFGNGAERMLCNKNIGSHILNLNFNRHSKEYLYRAALEGIAFSFVYGMEIMKVLGINAELIRVGNDNLFRSSIFSNTISALLNSKIEVVEVNGAIGAARAAGINQGIFKDIPEAMSSTKVEEVFDTKDSQQKYLSAYNQWKKDLNKLL